MQLIIFFVDTETTALYTLSLHDALPISLGIRAALLGIAHGVDALADALQHRIVALAERHLLRVLEEDGARPARSEEHTSELQSQSNLVCRLLLEKKKNKDTS